MAGAAPLRWLGGILLAAAALLALYITSLHSYLLFHALIELFTIVVAAGIFVIAWNARAYLQNNYLLFVGIASLFVAFIGLFHVLAYQGMGVFSGSTSNLATQLWLAARSLEAAALVLAPFFLGRRLRAGVQLAACAAVTGLLVGSIYAGVFPASFVDGVGLTPFKVGAEYVISAAFLVATGLLVWKREAFAPPVWRLVAASLVLTVAAELAFTEYVSVYGSANLAGHFLRLVASYLLYKAIIETGLVTPFGLLLRDVKLSQERLQDYATALEAANAELRARAADLAERNEDLDAFTRTVAHDLKSPVAAMVTAARVVTSYELPRDQTRLLAERLASTASDLSDIIDNLLLLARVRREDAPREPVDMASLVAAVRHRFDGMIRECQAEIAVPDEWPRALAYGPWIEEVWANYLTNALKYGGPRPRIELGASPGADGMLRFWVRDHGPGLPPDARARLFVPFRQLRVGRGHGLGLSIVLQIVEKLGGDVGVECNPGEGTLFFFTLPAVPSGPAAAT